MPRSPSTVVCLLAIATAAVAQDEPVRFVTKTPFVRFAVHDAPGFLAAMPKTRLGKLLATPDVSGPFAEALQGFVHCTRGWAELVGALEAMDAGAVDWSTLLQKELWTLDWRDVKGLELISTRGGADTPTMQTTILLEPVTAAEGRLTQRFEALVDAVWKKLAPADGESAQPQPEQKIDGHPARITAQKTDSHMPMMASGAWFVHLPGQFAAGTGDPAAAGSCRSAPVPPPAVGLELDVGEYFRFISQFIGAAEPFTKVMDALGVGKTFRLSWRVEPQGELLRDELTLEFGEAAGLPAALIHAAAPLVDQTLPEDGLMQLRCSFDVRELVAVADELLEQSDMQTLKQLGIADDLHKAWTGGVAIAIGAPPKGGLVPRVFASFGIVDAAALERLLTRLTKEPWLERKDVAYEEQACVQLKLPGAPPALTPTWCVRDGTIHFAESGTSMRAMLKAIAANAPAALDVGDAPRPDGKGAIVPGFDLRYDGAAIYAALRDTWLPALELSQSLGPEGGPKALLSRDDLPEAGAIAEHLVRGRGILRQHPDRLVLAMSGTAGGPALLTLLTMFGPLSSTIAQSWQWNSDAIAQQISRKRLAQLHDAIEAFTKRTGKRPDSLADLIGTEITDVKVLAVEGLKLTEPVLRDGKEIAVSSFRYFPDGVKLSPSGDEVLLRLIAIQATAWQRIAMDKDGNVHEGWGDFASKPLDELVGRK